MKERRGVNGEVQSGVDGLRFDFESSPLKDNRTSKKILSRVVRRKESSASLKKSRFFNTHTPDAGPADSVLARRHSITPKCEGLLSTVSLKLLATFVEKL
jgi:hypothetical protein